MTNKIYFIISATLLLFMAVIFGTSFPREWTYYYYGIVDRTPYVVTFQIIMIEIVVFQVCTVLGFIGLWKYLKEKE